MSVDLPPEAGEWQFEARRFALSEGNTAAEIRGEIDDIVGTANPRWEDTNGHPGHFPKEELAMLLLALGGPQEVQA